MHQPAHTPRTRATVHRTRSTQPIARVIVRPSPSHDGRRSMSLDRTRRSLAPLLDPEVVEDRVDLPTTRIGCTRARGIEMTEARHVASPRLERLP
jgi:hypothetical protein